MRKITFIIGLLLLMALSYSKGISKEEFYRQFQQLKDLSKTKTNGWQLVSSMNTEYFTIATSLSKNKIDQLYQLNIPQHAIKEFKAVLFAKKIVSSSFRIELYPDKAKALQGLGVVELDGDNVKLYYGEATTTGTLIEQKEPVERKKCKRKWFKKKCTHWIEMVPRGFTLSELEVIKQTLRVKAANDLQIRISNLMGLSTLE